MPGVKRAKKWEIAPDEAAVLAYYEKLPLPTRLVAKELDEIARATIPHVRCPSTHSSGTLC